MPPKLLAPPQPVIGEEIRKPPPGLPRDMHLRGLHEAARDHPCHRAGDVRAAGAKGLRDPVLCHLLRGTVVLLEVRPVDQI